MSFKSIQEKLAQLRDRIAKEGDISKDSEEQLQNIVHEALMTANNELEGIHEQLQDIVAKPRRADAKTGPSNDNRELSADQKARLQMAEKLGHTSNAVH